MEKIVELKNVSKTYKTGEKEFKALDSIDLSINKGELVVVLGPSGADEPTGALDSKTGVEVLKLLKKQCDRNNGSNTVIIVTHNALFADIADTVIRVKNGKIESVTPNSNPKKIDEVKW